MQSQELSSHKVLSGSNAARKLKAPHAIVRNHRINCPLSSAQTLARDLEPSLTTARGASCVVYLGKVDLDGTLVRLGNWIIRVVGSLRTADDMLPVCSDGITSLNVDDRGGRRARGTASQTTIASALDGVIVARGTKTDKETLVSAIDKYFLENCVRVGSSNEKERRSGPLHGEL